MLEEAILSVDGLSYVSHLALAPDGAVFALAELEPPPSDEVDDSDDDGPFPPLGVLARLTEGRPELLATARARAAGIAASSRFVVCVEETDERYVLAASAYDRGSGAMHRLALGREGAGLLSSCAVGESMIVPGNEQLFRVDAASGSPVPLLRGRVRDGRVGMGSDLVVLGDTVFWSTVGDTTAPAQLHRAALTGGEPAVVLRGEREARIARLAAHEEEILFEWNRQDLSNGRLLATELRAFSPATGRTRRVAALEPFAIAALVVWNGIAYVAPRAIGVDAKRAGILAIDLSSGKVELPAHTASLQARTLVHHAGVLYVSVKEGIRRFRLQ